MGNGGGKGCRSRERNPTRFSYGSKMGLTGTKRQVLRSEKAVGFD